MALQQVAGLRIKSSMRKISVSTHSSVVGEKRYLSAAKAIRSFSPLKSARPKPVWTDVSPVDTAWDCNPADWGETARLQNQIPQRNAHCVVEPGNRRNGLTAQMQSGHNAPKERRTLLNRQEECGPHDRGELFVA